MTGKKGGEISLEMKHPKFWDGYGLHAASILKKKWTYLSRVA
jgi:hypothetical protein